MAILDVFNWQGVSVAPGATRFTVAPSWTRLDTLSETRVVEVQIRRGRSDEFERTDTGTMSVGFNDRGGAVDPTSVDWTSRPLAFAVRNPVTGVWFPRFRGDVDSHRYNLHPSRIKGDVVIEAVDALAYFAGFELAPGLAGDPPPPESEGYVYYEATPLDSGSGMQTRINQALADAGWPTGLASIFTGNVSLLPGIYSPGEALLSVIHEAVDAEFPGVANFLVDKYGVVCARGRFARFDPASVAASATHWDFNTWTCGSSGAQITWPFQAERTSRMIRNAAMSYPKLTPTGAPFPTAQRADQVVIDSGSISTHGTRSWSAENLLTRGGFTTGLTGPEECLTFAQYIVDNYAEPQLRLPQVTLRAVHPADPRAAAVWAMACRVDISDLVTVNMGHPGGGGVAMSGFVEGITETWRPWVGDLSTGYPYFEMTLDLSPASYWENAPGEWTPA